MPSFLNIISYYPLGYTFVYKVFSLLQAEWKLEFIYRMCRMSNATHFLDCMTLTRLTVQFHALQASPFTPHFLRLTPKYSVHQLFSIFPSLWFLRASDTAWSARTHQNIARAICSPAFICLVLCILCLKFAATVRLRSRHITFSFLSPITHSNRQEPWQPHPNFISAVPKVCSAALLGSMTSSQWNPWMHYCNCYFEVWCFVKIIAELL
jgi:hypothetical protein